MVSFPRQFQLPVATQVWKYWVENSRNKEFLSFKLQTFDLHVEILCHTAVSYQIC
jgi:hypothetical protein